eukprot:gene30163-36440_t
MESDVEDMYLARNLDIIQELQEKDPDIICLQEFWLSNEKLVDLYEHAFGQKYLSRYLLRQSTTAHNQNNPINSQSSSNSLPLSHKRKDGLAIFVKKNRFAIDDTQEILFQDGGDRVALLLRLRALEQQSQVRVSSSYAQKSASDKSFVVVNTHLLFPHNEGSKMISVREVAKILGFLETYERKLQGENILLQEPRLPVILAGDFNHPAHGKAFSLLHRRGFKNAYIDMHENPMQMHSLPSQHRHPYYVSHLNHKGEVLAADHVYVYNPANMHASHAHTHAPDGVPPTTTGHANTNTHPTDWTDMVYGELVQRILEKYSPHAPQTSNARTPSSAGNMLCKVEWPEGAEGAESAESMGGSMCMLLAPDHLLYSLQTAFLEMDEDKDGTLSFFEFQHGLKKLGFFGESAPHLTDSETLVLFEGGDQDRDGLLTYQEWVERVCRACLGVDVDVGRGLGGNYDQYEGGAELAGDRAAHSSSKVIDLGDMTEDDDGVGGGWESLIPSLYREVQKEEGWGKGWAWEDTGGHSNLSHSPVMEDGEDGMGVWEYGRDDHSPFFPPLTPPAHFSHTTLSNEEVVRHLLDKGRDEEGWRARGEFLSPSLTLTPAAPAPALARHSLTAAKPIRSSLRLNVRKVEVFPCELLNGEWPSSYTLSDHGAVMCIFSLESP